MKRRKVKKSSKKKVKRTIPLRLCVSKFKFNLKKLNFQEKVLLERFLMWA